jgi:predicted amidohydrolase YtcJ
MVTDLDRRGIRVIAHCTGDGASDIFLNAVSVARQRNGDGVRHQCAHSTALLDENLARFAELDVTAEFSPVGWLPSPFSNQRLVFGEERWERMYNFKGVLDAGGNAVMGTDWPVSYIDPWIGFEAMVTRKNPFSTDDQKFYGEAITLEQAMEVMTVNGARCMGIEATAGNIVVGKSADLIVLDANPFEIECRGKLHSIGVDLTFLQGQLEWDKNGLFRDSALQPTWCESLPSFVAG